ncbi:protein of unknown function [Pseudomonas linyingensis]|uniref:DUF4399 domain-containing protein n=1 Tax=Pseudomonas linyingensis TaxID=915471 RepID=A0A1H6VUL0_9PSED|nr:DUF4399 domain-containing protein [Pseudomonas linyingensis]SEJ08339.1 protein of unknown function [Pseudomonas linyingensis]
MKTLLAACGLLATVTLATPALAETPRTPAPEGASVYFIAPANGASVTGPVNVRFGLKGMGVAPAGTDVPATGHHHLLVDVAELPGLDAPLPATDNIRHFGKGQTETELTLPPGKHTLQLLLGDQNHVPHQPPVLSEKITITVK